MDTAPKLLDIGDLESFEHRLSIVEEKLDSVLDLLTKIKGAGIAIKFLFWIGPVLGGVIYWFKHYVTW